ncbi:MAG: mannitol-1-phosphate 5-dehydrogenase, partial [Candidatus Hydrogenedentota bacterium]
MSKPKAVHFGAGSIGRGFLGQLYYESGYHTVFVDVVDTVVRALNERGEYPIRITDEESYTITVRDVSGINATDTEAVAEAVSEAEIVSTAVGVDALPRVAPALAGGITKRFADPDAPPLDVIICENLLNAGAFLRDEVRALTPTVCQDVLE